MMKLTTMMVKSLAKAGVPLLRGDGGGLYLQVSKTGGVSWIYRYKIGGKGRYMGLGPFPAITLAQAREAAADARRQVARGIDPLDAREADRESKRKADNELEAKRVTFKAASEMYRERHGSAWSEKWNRGWWRKLELYAFPVIGDMAVAEVDTAVVLKILTPIWISKTRTADEVRGQIEQVLDAAKALGWRQNENPARWRGHLVNLLSNVQKKKARKREHFPALDWRALPELMGKLAKITSRDAYAARFLILTGARTHMVRFSTWDEINFDEKVWSIPDVRMKARVAFNIPLSDEALSLLALVKANSESNFVFPGRGRSGVMHANAIRSLLHDLGYLEITRHGFRSSFRDWAGETTNFPREICEMALAHDTRGETESAYSRSDFFEKRRSLMAAWATYANNKVAVEGF